MKTNCPHCRKELDYAELNFEADLQMVIALLETFGKQAHLVMAYAYLFGVTPFRLRAKKLRLILEEIKKLFDAQTFAYQKQNYPVSQAGIAEALDITVKKHFATPLDSHNYLKKIMISISEREGREAGKISEVALREKEEKLRCAERPLPEEARENLKKVYDIINGIGNKK